MHTVTYTRWNPPQSPLEIEFGPDFVRDLRIEPDRESSGILYGVRRGRELRLVTARREVDLSLGDLSAEGVYFYRVRGEVFLTEEDLDRFERSGAEVALVVAGGRAGFFVHEADGALQSVRSHEEFLIQGIAAEGGMPAPARPTIFGPTFGTTFGTNQARRSRLGIASAAILAAAVLAIPLGALAYFLPLYNTPLDLQLQERDGQLLIGWNPRADVAGGQLEIMDGSTNLVASIRQGQTGVTYPIADGDITVTLHSASNGGPSEKKSVRFMARGPARVQ